MVAKQFGELSPTARRLEMPRGAAITIEINGEAFTAHEGETLAAVLFAAGLRVFSNNDGASPKSLYCGMGVCQQCLVAVNGEHNRQACITTVQPGMRIDTRPWAEVVATPNKPDDEVDRGRLR